MKQEDCECKTSLWNGVRPDLTNEETEVPQLNLWLSLAWQQRSIDSLISRLQRLDGQTTFLLSVSLDAVIVSSVFLGVKRRNLHSQSPGVCICCGHQTPGVPG